MMKALIFAFFMIIFITAGFMFMAYVGCGGDFFNRHVGAAGALSFLASLSFSPLFFFFYDEYMD
ncbi:hypothetical protein [Gilliamella sp. B3783]|uniref:hypothetical protein n=2 Tax=Gilliamella TaxID=1193503 RepID=UPI00226A464F|nr:hypothetical protein [Gilliamella sp. B3783]